ncbi:hypothetical protein NP493_313g01011 [Ridgeia piscesae]|uniref:Patched domain-containing protein n=1 Tax=Ridgeia piscesae TaxID=27915 RepID=A0AAD9NW19_RIDPI|nr:hypothetical protein NP493_313g01011 [Ridgeia piscesae]
MKTDCVEKPISQAFAKYGRFVAKHPLLFVIIPLVLAVVLVAGLQFYELEIEMELLFTQEHVEGELARFIATPKSGNNLFADDVFQEVIRLDIATRAITVAVDGQNYTYEDVCARQNGKCLPDPVIMLSRDFNIPPHEIHFPEQLYAFTTHALDLDMSENAKSVQPLFAASFGILLLFSILSCLSDDWVRSKPVLATLGVVSAALAVGSGYGLMMHMRVPFNDVVGSGALLVMGMEKLTQSVKHIGLLVVYIIYLVVAIWGIARIGEGLQMKRLMADDSPASQFMDAEGDHFNVYGPTMQVAVNTELEIWKQSEIDKLNALLDRFGQGDALKHFYSLPIATSGSTWASSSAGN